jgi:hypothetical protein
MIVRTKISFFYPRFLGKSFPKAEQTTSYTLMGGIADPILAKVIGDISELDQLATNAMARDTVARLKVRYGMINLGHLRREVESALMFVSA